MGQLFISHNHADAALACKLVTKLRKAGKKVWVDYDGIPPGKSLPESINNAIKKCSTFILLWSESASRSTWVQREWGAALAGNKKIITCRLDKAKLPLLLQVDLYIEFGNFNKGFLTLIKSLS